MRVASPKVLSTIANAIVLSPGTMAVDAIAEPPTLFIHVLALDDITEVRRRAAHLEAMVIEALGSAGDRAALARWVVEGSRT
jgi:multisubunit Na+/H+ antiporter MnhE subunit